MLHVDINKSHVNIIMLHVDIIYLACRGQKYVTIQIEIEICIILLHFIYNFMRQKWKPVFVDMISSFPYVTYALISLNYINI